MTDVPPDARAVLAQLLAEARAGRRERAEAETLAALDTVERVARNKVPDSELRERLVHGCDRVRATVGDDPAVAGAYLRAMERLVAE